MTQSTQDWLDPTVALNAEIERLQKLISDVAVHVRPGDLPSALFYRLTAQALTPDKRREE